MKKSLFTIMLILILSMTGCTINIDSTKDDIDDLNFENSQEENTEEEVKRSGLSSSKDHPLNVGEMGIASKYNVIKEEYLDVDVKLLEVLDNPDAIIEQYNKNNPDNVLNKTAGFKFVVIDYEVTLIDFETESFGIDVGLDVEIKDASDKEFVVSDVKQVIDVKNISEDAGVIKNGTGRVRIAFEIPNETTNYLVKLGTNSHTIAYYKI